MNWITYYRWNRWLHKWAGLALSLQLLFWIGGGTIMASLDIDEVHGDHLRHPQSLQLAIADYRYPLNALLVEHGLNAKQVAFISVGNEPVYKIVTDQVSYFSAVSGQPMPTLDKQYITDTALSLFTQTADITSAELLQELPMEARPLRPPMWRVDFADKDNTSFYLHPISGELQRVRSDIWRLFDFVWMLHIMDYDERDDFNHPLLVAFAASALLFTLTGVMLLYQTLVARRPVRKK